MVVQESVYVALHVVGATLALAIAGYTWRNRTTPAARELSFLTGSVAMWVLSNLAIVLAPSPTVARVVFLFRVVGVVATVAGVMVFTLAYTGWLSSLPSWTVPALAVEPVLIVLVRFTNHIHHLYYRQIRFPPDAMQFTVEVGPAYLLNTAYSYLLLVVATGLLLWMLYRSQSLYRGQVYAVFGAIVVPWSANVLHEFGVTDIEYTSLAFVVTGLLLAFAVFRFEFMTIAPVAKGTIFDNLNAGVLVVDAKETVVDVNAVATELLESTPEDVLGQPASEALTEIPPLYDHYQSVAGTATGSQFELDVRDETYQVETTPLFGYHDQVVGWQFLLSDVTEQKHRQRELQRRNEQLDQFTSIVSHDLRSPLTVTKGHLGLVRDDLPDDNAETMERSLDRMESMIDDLLTMARAGQTVEEATPVSLAAVAGDALEHVRAPDTAFDFAVSDDVRVKADADRLLHVFENLFRNAQEHNERPVTIRVGTLEATSDERRDGHPAGFYVEDDGSGIPDDHRADIFEDGYTTGRDNTGLGLAIVRGVVTAHGWEVHVTEGTDSGARFEVTNVEFVD
jgi:signal transduction histidine kinase